MNQKLLAVRENKTAISHVGKGRATKTRLAHVDAMRPLKQLGVVTNHSLIFFAPAASIFASSSILLLHVTREAFLFIGACMLTYAYPALRRQDLKRFYRRRFMAVGIPYICWTIIYFALSFKVHHYSWSSGLERFGIDALTGYYQLYFLVVLMEFYLLYPLLQKAIRRASNYHLQLLIVSFIVQVVYVSLMHWHVFPRWLQNNWANRELMSYQFYLIGGMLAAYHFEAFHAWVVAHYRAILYGTALSALMAVLWVVIAGVGNVVGMGYESDPFQPIVIPFNIGAILSVYLLGLWLSQREHYSLVRRITMSGAENSYGIYAAQLVFLNGLVWIGFKSLHLPWIFLAVLGLSITYAASWLLTAILARTVLARALTGRKRQTWSSLLPVRWLPPAMIAYLSLSSGTD